MKVLLAMVAAALVLGGCGQLPKIDDTQCMKMEQTINLLQPEDNGVTLMAALKGRRSVREFAAEPLSLSQVSGALWAAYGINREDGKRTAPSALALYPLTVYAFFAEGVYAYNPADNTLNRVAEGDHRAISGMQDWVATAPMNLVYVADLSVYSNMPPYLEDVKRLLAAQDAACCVENANLWAAANNMGAVTRGSFKEPEILSLLGLDAERYTVVMAQSLGNLVKDGKETSKN